MLYFSAAKLKALFLVGGAIDLRQLCMLWNYGIFPVHVSLIVASL